MPQKSASRVCFNGQATRWMAASMSLKNALSGTGMMSCVQILETPINELCCLAIDSGRHKMDITKQPCSTF
ncbi:hypothetical protein TNCV_3900161 [Trichonephila clavipes]|nr:hypothetical protein TNCV_3900161 [Trichonephila clavipes]